MPIALSPEQEEFFAKHSYLELENLFSMEEKSLLQESIASLLHQKEPILHDVWRKNPSIQKITSHRKLKQILAQLFHQPKVRLAFDQVLSSDKPLPPLFPSKTTPLQAFSSFTPLLGAVLIRLTEDPSPPLLTPKILGNPLFFSSQFPFPWPHLRQNPRQQFFLIAFGPIKLQYVYKPEDPYVHEGKKMGYAFGDFLQDSTHPL